MRPRPLDLRRRFLPLPIAGVLLIASLAATPAAAQATSGAAAPALHEREVSFPNGDVRLAGVVLSPTAGGDETAPAVVIIHGSGPSDRSQAWAAGFARGLAERGFVVLLPDKRGSGRSGGDWRSASFEDLADDAIAGVEALRGLDGVDRDRVGLVGLSQGGHVAPLAAGRSADVAFVVDVSGSAVPIVEQVIDEVEKLAQRAGFTPEQVDRVNALHRQAIAYGLSGEGWDDYRASLERALAGDLAGHGVVEPFPRTRDHWVWAFARAVGPYDPLTHWRALEVPAVIAYGAHDTQIHVAESVDLLLGLPNDEGAPRTVLVFGDSGHGLREPGSDRIRRDLLDFLWSWVGLLGAERPAAGAGAPPDAAASDSAVPAPAATPPRCSSADHRRFDFWVGTWEVRGAALPEAPPGRNMISLEQGGCVLREQYVNGRYGGTSLSFYDAGAGRWRQTWIDNQGQPLLIAGGWQDGSMTISGPEGAAPTDRVTWTPNADGSVRQLWEKSADGGATWTAAFDGLYTRAGAGGR